MSKLWGWGGYIIINKYNKGISRGGCDRVGIYKNKKKWKCKLSVGL